MSQTEITIADDGKTKRNDQVLMQNLDLLLNTIHRNQTNITKTQMKEIVEIALANSQRAHKQVVFMVETFISYCSPKQKLTALYIIDAIISRSIRKNGPNDLYASRFSKNLLTTYLNLYKNCSDADRPKVVARLASWNRSKLISDEVLVPLVKMINSFENQRSQNNRSTSNQSSSSSSSTNIPSAATNTDPKFDTISDAMLFLLKNFEGNTDLANQFQSILVSLNNMQESAKKMSQNGTVEGGSETATECFQSLTDKTSTTPIPCNDMDYRLIGQTSISNNGNGPSYHGHVEPSEDVSSSCANRGHHRSDRHHSKSRHQTQSSTSRSRRSNRSRSRSWSRSRSRERDRSTIGRSGGHDRWRRSRSRSFDGSSYARPRTPQQSDQNDSMPNDYEDEKGINNDSPSKSRRDIQQSRRRSESPKESGSAVVDSSSADTAETRRSKVFPPPKPDCLTVACTTLWIGHVPKTISNDDIEYVFSKFGPTSSINVIHSRGCAYVSMTDRLDAAKACQTIKRYPKLFGTTVKIAWAQGKNLKEYQGYFDSAIGCWHIPHSLLNCINMDMLNALEDGNIIDLETMNDYIRTLREWKIKQSTIEQAEAESTAKTVAEQTTPATTSVAVPPNVDIVPPIFYPPIPEGVVPPIPNNFGSQPVPLPPPPPPPPHHHLAPQLTSTSVQHPPFGHGPPHPPVPYPPPPGLRSIAPPPLRNLNQGLPPPPPHGHHHHQPSLLPPPLPPPPQMILSGGPPPIPAAVPSSLPVSGSQSPPPGYIQDAPWIDGEPPKFYERQYHPQYPEFFRIQPNRGLRPGLRGHHPGPHSGPPPFMDRPPRPGDHHLRPPGPNPQFFGGPPPPPLQGPPNFGGPAMPSFGSPHRIMHNANFGNNRRRPFDNNIRGGGGGGGKRQWSRQSRWNNFGDHGDIDDDYQEPIMDDRGLLPRPEHNDIPDRENDINMSCDNANDNMINNDDTQQQSQQLAPTKENDNEDKMQIILNDQQMPQQTNDGDQV
ncbi:nucleic acid binding [Blomia tropicalis]|nr:nucleic acid binding [Blomia tropicalis]